MKREIKQVINLVKSRRLDSYSLVSIIKETEAEWYNRFKSTESEDEKVQRIQEVIGFCEDLVEILDPIEHEDVMAYLNVTKKFWRKLGLDARLIPPIAEELNEFLQNRKDILIDAHFNLGHGIHSNRFINFFPLFENRTMMKKLCLHFIERFPEKILKEVNVIVGPYPTSLPLIQKFALLLNGQSNNVRTGYFCKRGGYPSFFGPLRGQKIIVIDASLIRGTKMQPCIDMIQKNGGQVISTGVLVDLSIERISFRVNSKRRLLRPIALIQRNQLRDFYIYRQETCPLCQKDKTNLIQPAKIFKSQFRI
jgi:orotate phosphoribosyltransferase